MPMRVIAKKRCHAMFEPPEKGERATLNPNLSTSPKPGFFRSGPWAAGGPLPVEEGERRCLAVVRGRKTPHAPQQTASLFDHLVGAGEQRRWHVNSECLGRLHVDDQFETGWLFDR
jgi:hypothetical protein